MDFAISEGEVYLLRMDPRTMSREEFLEGSNYLDTAQTVLVAVDSDGDTVTYEYRVPEELAGQLLVLRIEGPDR